MWLAIILVLSTLVLVKLFFSRKKIPGPWNLPILGYLPWLDPSAPHVTLTKLSKKFGPIYGLYMGSVYTVVLSDVKMIRRVLARDETTGRAPLYLTHGIMQGYGVICAEGDLWKDQRKFLTSCLKQFGMQKFGNKRKIMEKLIMEEVRDCIEFIKSSKTLDVNEVCRHNIGSTMNKMVFGISYERNDPEWTWLQTVQEEGVRLIGVAGPLNFLPFLRFIPKFANSMKFLKSGQTKTHKLYKRIIEERKKKKSELLTETNGKNDKEEEDAKLKNGILTSGGLKEEEDTCASNGVLGEKSLKEDNDLDSKKMEIENILEAFLVEKEKRRGTTDYEAYYNETQFFHMLADVFGAGLDTTLVTTSWFLLFMASNMKMQSDLQEELDYVLKDREFLLEDMAALPLLEASIAEAQRIRSVVPLGIPHGSLQDTKIEGYDVPRGTMIVPLQWAVHMNEEHWLEPEVYNPRRFLNEEGKFVRHEAFIPFQTGKRMCVGDELARMFLFLFLGNIIHEFKVEFKEPGSVDLEGVIGITLTPKPHELIFTPRKV